MKKTNDKSGFTLIELIIVLAVIGIMIAIAAPNIMSWVPNLRFRDNSRNMLFDMQFAKTSAVKRNTNVVFLFTANGYTIFVDDGAGTGTANNNSQDGTEETLKTVSLPNDIIITNSNLAADLVPFNYMGLPGLNFSVDSNKEAGIHIANNQSRQIDLIISLAGGVKIGVIL